MAAVRVSIELVPEHPADELVDAIVTADRLGFHACYCADETYHKDMWQLFAAAAARTSRIRLSPGVTHVILKDPTIVAQQAATLDELTGGRAELVFSIGNVAMLDQYHVAWEGTRPMRRLREAHAVMRTFLDTGAIDFEGEYYRYTGLFTAARPVQRRLPIKLGAMKGPRSFALAGEIADGVYVACSFSREALEFAATHVREGASRANRDPEDVELAASFTSAIAADGDAAREGARIKAAFYIPSMARELIERHGIEYATVEPAVAAFARGDVASALALTPPEAADALGLAGTPAEIAARIHRDVLPAGFDHVVFALADRFLVERWSGRRIEGLPSLADQIRLLHDELLPLLT